MSQDPTLDIPLEAGVARTGNVLPLLHEIRHALQCWLDSGTPAMIDLRSIPMAPGEDEELTRRLGEGEVQARLSALGPSDIQETRYPGVWLVTHYNEDREIMGRFIEVTDMPAILKSQAVDVRAGLENLQHDLAELDLRKL